MWYDVHDQLPQAGSKIQVRLSTDPCGMDGVLQGSMLVEHLPSDAGDVGNWYVVDPNDVKYYIRYWRFVQ